MKKKLSILLQLTKVTVAIPVTVLCIAGYYMQAHNMGMKVWIAAAGVFLLSAASSALNQIVEKKYDILMDRTKTRPLPAGAITIRKTWMITALLTITGTILLLSFSMLTMLLGLLAIVWYILVYTLLKRVTPFATIPGAITGAIPLLIGYAASGGNICNQQILWIAAFVYIWQIPHFWLLMLLYGNDYEKAGFPTLFRVFPERNLKFWTMGWITTAAIYSLGLVLFGVSHSLTSTYLLLIINLLILSISAHTLIYKSNGQTKTLFHLLNFYMLAVIAVIVLVG